jgi:hypothetical protein
MGLYTDTQVGTILTTAANSLYLLQNQSERERYMDSENSLEEQVRILFSTKKAVEWARSKGITTDAYNGLVSYLYHKCQKAYAGLSGVSNPSGTPPSDGEASTVQAFFWEFLVEAAPASDYPAAGDTIWVNGNFVNRVVEVEYGNVPMSGVELTDGSVYFLKPFSSNTLRFYNMPGGLAEGALLKVRAFATT